LAAASLATAPLTNGEESHPRRRRYYWTQEANAYPRNLMASPSDRVREYLDRGRRGERILVEAQEYDSIMQIVTGLVAALPSKAETRRRQTDI
jgi:hypothetical protein